MNEHRFRKAFLVLLVVAISAGFVAMIRMFLLTLLLAAIFAGVARPLYLWLLGRMGGRRPLAAAATLLVLLVAVIAPLIALAGAVATEALSVAQNAGPRIQAQLAQPNLVDTVLRRLPYMQQTEPIRQAIVTRGAELVGNVGTFLAAGLSAATKGTVLFVFHFFILLYAMFFFLMDGPRMLRAMTAHLPLSDEDNARMLEKFTSVARATLKGTIFIGATQGTLSGIAFWLAGIDGAIFWTTLMIVLSIIPGIGGALVWVPAVILLLAQGAVWKGLGLALFCALIVGSIDNVLRPWLVGRDTRMHDLLILISTLGGLVVFGPLGFIVGPILAALFVTVWEIFGTAFREELKDGQTPTVPPVTLTGGR